jgi:hypothetical protein
MMRLWHRNVVGAGVSVAALAVIGATMLWPDWSDYRDSTHPEHVVPAAESGVAAGRSWRVASVRYFSSSPNVLNPQLPQGTVVHVVTIDRTGGDGPAGCAGIISDGQRRWSAETAGGYGPLPPEGASAYCSTPGPVQFSFLLPGDVTPEFVDVTDGSGRILVRLML